MKKLVLFLMPVMLFIIVFIPIKNNFVYWSLYLVLFALFFAFYYLDSVVKDKDIKAYLNATDYWSVKAGYIKINGNNSDIINGRLVIYKNIVYFFKRSGGKEKVILLKNFPVSDIATYTINKVDDFHEGIVFSLNNGEEVLFSSKAIKNDEEGLNRALGWL